MHKKCVILCFILVTFFGGVSSSSFGEEGTQISDKSSAQEPTLNEEKDVVYLDQTTLDNLECRGEDCFFPKQAPSYKDIYIVDKLTWNKTQNLIIRTHKSIIWKGDLIAKDAMVFLCYGSPNITFYGSVESKELYMNLDNVYPYTRCAGIWMHMGPGYITWN